MRRALSVYVDVGFVVGLVLFGFGFRLECARLHTNGDRTSAVPAVDTSRKQSPTLRNKKIKAQK